MTNKQWDEYHKKIFMNVKIDKDLEKFFKRFYRDDKEKRSMLDLGCGQGVSLAYTSHTYKTWKCYGCDYSAKALCITNHRLKHRGNVFIRQADAKDTKYKDCQFDLVVDVVLFASVKDYVDVVKEAHRVLKPRGKIFIKEISDNECNTDNKYLRRDDVIKFNEKQLYDLLNDNGFEKIETYKSRVEHQNIEHVVCVGRKI